MKTLLLRLIRPVIPKQVLPDILFSIIRLFCGLVLAIDFGASKFGMPWTDPGQNLKLFEVAAWFPEDVASYGGIFGLAPVFFAWMGAFSEAVGGVLLALGLQTRVAAFLIACTMLTAVFMQQLDRGLYACLPALGFLWVAVYTLYFGSGRFGIDYIIFKNVKK